MDDAALVEAADSNYFDTFRTIGRAAGVPVLDADGILCVAIGVPAAALNIVFVTRPLEEPERALEAGIAFFDRLDLPFIVRVREGVDPAAERAVERLGLPYSDTVPGMAVSPILAAPARPAELRLERIGTDRLDEFAAVAAEGFGMPLPFAEAMAPPALIEAPGVACYLGYVDDVPVATSILTVTGKTAGIYNVATLPSHRRRGFGEAMTWQAMEDGAQAGCNVATLQASEMGQPIYERMGFRLVAPYRTFHRPGV